MGVSRFRWVLGGVLAVTAAGGAASLAGTVPAMPETDVIAPPTAIEPAGRPDISLTQDIDTNAGIPDVLTAHGADVSTLELFGDFPADQPAAWSPGFEGGSMTGGPAPASGASGSALSSVPDQVMIPLPSAAWTGLTSLAGIGLFGMMKHFRRFFT